MRKWKIQQHEKAWKDLMREAGPNNKGPFNSDNGHVYTKKCLLYINLMVLNAFQIKLEYEISHCFQNNLGNINSLYLR